MTPCSVLFFGFACGLLGLEADMHVKHKIHPETGDAKQSMHGGSSFLITFNKKVGRTRHVNSPSSDESLGAVDGVRRLTLQ